MYLVPTNMTTIKKWKITHVHEGVKKSDKMIQQCENSSKY
jgi:hypothetical protein